MNNELMREYMIILKSKELSVHEHNLTRSEKYDILKTHYLRYWGMIISFIDVTDLHDDVSKFQNPTSFNFLFITCSENVAEHIRGLSYVQSVAYDMSIELIT